MEYKIVVDSSSNLMNDYIKDTEVGFEVVPLTIRIDDKEFVDDENVDVEELLKRCKESSKAGQTSCPSPNDFLNSYEGAQKIICITISKKLSGSYNSATVAAGLLEDKSKEVFVVDSKLVTGVMRLLVDKAYELIKKGIDFETIKTEMNKFRDSLNLYFVLDKFDNLVKNGRMNKVVAFIASKIAIKPLCYGEDGEIKIKEKIRTFRGVLKRLAVNIGKICPDNISERTIVISHTQNLEDAEYLKTLIEEEYNFKNIIIEENRGLCAFYSLQGGILVSF